MGVQAVLPLYYGEPIMVVTSVTIARIVGRRTVKTDVRVATIRMMDSAPALLEVPAPDIPVLVQGTASDKDVKGASLIRDGSTPLVETETDGPPAATPKGSPVGAIVCLTAFQCVRTIVDVKDYGFFGRSRLDMGNVG